MTAIASILPYLQIALSLILIVLVLMQQSEADLGSAFGGGDNLGAQNRTRRGAEKIMFNSTIVVAILFVASAFVALLIK
jgi:preprotein translocase subunit SecG